MSISSVPSCRNKLLFDLLEEEEEEKEEEEEETNRKQAIIWMLDISFTSNWLAESRLDTTLLIGDLMKRWVHNE